MESYTKDRLTDMEFLSNVLKESMRMKPALAFSLPLETKEEVTICGVKIPKGAGVMNGI